MIYSANRGFFSLCLRTGVYLHHQSSCVNTNLLRLLFFNLYIKFLHVVHSCYMNWISSFNMCRLFSGWTDKLVVVVLVPGRFWSWLQLDLHLQPSGPRGDVASDGACACSPPVPQEPWVHLRPCSPSSWSLCLSSGCLFVCLYVFYYFYSIRFVQIHYFSRFPVACEASRSTGLQRTCEYNSWINTLN